MRVEKAKHSLAWIFTTVDTSSLHSLNESPVTMLEEPSCTAACPCLSMSVLPRSSPCTARPLTVAWWWWCWYEGWGDWVGGRVALVRRTRRMPVLIVTVGCLRLDWGGLVTIWLPDWSCMTVGLGSLGSDIGGHCDWLCLSMLWWRMVAMHC